MHWCYRVISSFLRTGPIPHHVAFIMDGNRRYAQKLQRETLEGHSSGYEKLKQTLEWCLSLGVGIVTVYAFSIDNFQRSEREVNGLMNLATEKLTQMLERGDIIDKHGVRVQVLGKLSLLPMHVQLAMQKAVERSAENTRVILNICFSYTSEQEMTDAAEICANGVRDGHILPSDITPSLYRRCLYTMDSPDPELLIRTSGETRFSDFLLWQCMSSSLMFISPYWPEFSFWHLGHIILQYQRRYQQHQQERKHYHTLQQQLQQQADAQTCITQWREQQQQQQEQQQGDQTQEQEMLPISMTPDELSAAISRLVTEREARIERFLSIVRSPPTHLHLDVSSRRSSSHHESPPHSISLPSASLTAVAAAAS